MDSGDKKKSKQIKPGKALKVLVHGKDYKEKKEKKEKARQQQKDLMSKYIKDDNNSQATNKEDSEEWKKYQEMLGKSDQHVETSKEKLSKMEAGFEGEMSKLWGMPVSTASANSPWTQKEEKSVLDEPIDEKNPPQVGWIGFEDDFSKSKDGDASKNDGETPAAAAAAKTLTPTQVTMDLLGLGDDTAASEPVAANKVSNDFTDFGAAQLTDPLAADDTVTESNGLNLIDDFLGITSEASLPSLPKDPLEQLKAMKTGSASKADDTKAEVEQTIDATQSDLDDMFGFGSGSVTTTDEATVNGDGNLFDIGADSSKNEENLDPFCVDLEKIRKESAEDTEQTTDVLSPTDDFDPRADISLEKLAVKPVSHDIPVRRYSRYFYKIIINTENL